MNHEPWFVVHPASKTKNQTPVKTHPAALRDISLSDNGLKFRLKITNSDDFFDKGYISGKIFVVEIQSVVLGLREVASRQRKQTNGVLGGGDKS